MKQFVKTFEDLIRRMLGPATSLFVFLFIFHGIDVWIRGTDDCWVPRFLYVFSNLSSQSAIIVATITFFGIGYVLSTLHSLLIDSHLQGSFESRDMELSTLRPKVIAKLQNTLWFNDIDKQFLNDDYILYEILGGIDPASTKSYVDNAKTYGIVSLTAGIALLSIWICRWEFFIFYIIGFILLRYLGLKLAKVEYHRRAVRLYVNFLMAPREKFESVPTDVKQTDQNEMNIQV